MLDEIVELGFVEHLGRCVYGGLYEHGRPSADSGGCRADMRELVRKLAPPFVPYPGGNFVSAYDWSDGVSNQGTHQYLRG